MGQFNHQVVLITGASSGLGAALAYEFASQGANLILLARRKDRLVALANDIDPTGQRVLVVPCDVRKDNDLEQAVKLAQQKFTQLDVVIANAGWGVEGNLEDLQLEDYRRLWETNVFGVLRTIYATLDDLKQTQGRYVIIGSIKGYFSLAGGSPYSTSKFALRALADALHDELTSYGISVTHICPGGIATELRRVDNQGIFHSDWPETLSPWLLLSPEQAAKQTVKAVYQRKRERILTNYGVFLVLFKRYFPNLMSWLIAKFKITGVAKSQPIR